MRFASSSYGEAGQNTIAAIRKRKDFDAGNLTGSRPHVANQRSRLPYVWQLDYRADLAAGRILFEVRSWDTPIAWYVEGEGWVMPPIGYTSYTSRQQGLVRRAFNLPRTVPRREHLGIRIDWEWEEAA